MRLWGQSCRQSLTILLLEFLSNVAKTHFYHPGVSPLSPNTILSSEYLGSVTSSSQSYHINVSYCRQRLTILLPEFLVAVTRSSDSCHLSLSTLSPEAHNPIIWVSQSCRQKLTILSPEAQNPIIWVSRHCHRKLTILLFESLSPVARSSQSCHQKLTVPSPGSLTAITIASHQRGLGAVLLANYVYLIFLAFAVRHLATQLWRRCGATWEVHGSACNTKRGPLIYMTYKSYWSTIFLHSFDCNQRSNRDEKYNDMLSGNLKTVVHIMEVFRGLFVIGQRNYRGDYFEKKIASHLIFLLSAEIPCLERLEQCIITFTKETFLKSERKCHCFFLVPYIISTVSKRLLWAPVWAWEGRISSSNRRLAANVFCGFLVTLEALYYKPENRGFESRWGGFFSIYLILPATLWHWGRLSL
jgi:hypothetical protein